MWRFSSPGRPNTNSTPSFSRHSTISRATRAHALGSHGRAYAGPFEHLSRELGVGDVLAQVLDRVHQRRRSAVTWLAVRAGPSRIAPGVESAASVSSRARRSAAIGIESSASELVGVGDRGDGTPTVTIPLRAAGRPQRHAQPPSRAVHGVDDQDSDGIRVVAGWTTRSARRPMRPRSRHASQSGIVDEPRAASIVGSMRSRGPIAQLISIIFSRTA